MNRQPDPLQPDAFEQRFSCHHTRAEERILSRVTYQASPNGVLEHIANDGQQVVALTKHAIMPTWLPQVIAGVLAVHIARILLRKPCKLRDIAVSVDGLNDQMHMIWHEAVPRVLQHASRRLRAETAAGCVRRWPPFHKCWPALRWCRKSAIQRPRQPSLRVRAEADPFAWRCRRANGEALMAGQGGSPALRAT